MRPLLPAALLALAACASGSARVDKPNKGDTSAPCVPVPGGADCVPAGTGTGTGGGTTGVNTWVGEDNPGTGPGASLYQIEGRIDAQRQEADPGGFFYDTDMRVEIWDDQGAPATGLEVHLDTATLGDTQLAEDPANPGRYEATVTGYARTYTLKVEPGDPQAWFEAETVGPEPHVFLNLPPQPWDITEPVDISWAPWGAMFAEIDTRGTGGIGIDDDGSFAIDPIQLDHEVGVDDEERVRLRRWNVVDLTAAIPQSWLEVQVEIERDPIDTTDPRSGNLDGDVILDGAFNGTTGDAHIVAWPDAADPQNSPIQAWVTIPDADFTDVAPYLLAALEPGDWYVIAYLDADGSDVGLPAPLGPTNGDPFDDAGITIDPNQTTNRDFDLAQTWQGW